LALLRELLAVERAMGRERVGAVAKGPRVIDLDLLLYVEHGSPVVMTTGELVLPHPEMRERRFVLEPLAEIAPEWIHPTVGATVRELLAGLGRDCDEQ
jgi:2-amino-4-hydroxy-6-hydroxymethyldihydropteridine diphosphokinase